MATYNTKAFDVHSRRIHPVLCNTAKDGSGTWYYALVDSDGHTQVDVLSGGGGTEYAEDAAHTSGDKGIMALAVRANTAAATGADGDYVPLIVDTNGRLHVLDQNSAAIKTAVELIDNAISGTEMQVDVVAALPAGTNAIGKLAANTGVDIGDVDILSIAAGTNQIGARSKCTLLNSGVLAADTNIKGSAGDVYWITISDTAALAIELNNSTDNSGTDLWAIDLPADGYAHFIFDPPIEFSAGIYLDVTTATCKVTVGYK